MAPGHRLKEVQAVLGRWRRQGPGEAPALPALLVALLELVGQHRRRHHPQPSSSAPLLPVRQRDFARLKVLLVALAQQQEAAGEVALRQELGAAAGVEHHPLVEEAVAAPERHHASL